MPKAVFIDENGCKPCSKCKKILPATADNFWKSKNVNGWASWCIPCARKAKADSDNKARNKDPEAYAKRRRGYIDAYHQRHPERRKEQDRKQTLKRNFGLTPEQYQEILDSQGGVCAICKKRPNEDTMGRVFAVDHDHNCCPGRATCGKCIRGILCFTCNAGLGGLENYLEEVRSYLDAYYSVRCESKR